MIKYLGSKRTLLPWILETIEECAQGEKLHVLDLFSGTSRVGHALKAAGHRVTANDWNTYAATLARCYVQSDVTRAAEAEALLLELASLPGRSGYFTETFCERARFFQPRNGARVDAIRDQIAAWDCDPELESILLTSLMEAADRVDSTTGVQMAYLKDWAPRARGELELRMPQLLSQPAVGPCRAMQAEAREAAAMIEADLVYLDPPYNQHKYEGNYHVWETLVRWDAPEHYGVARKRVDVRERRSGFNSKPGIAAALTEVVDALRARWALVSFSDEGFLSREELELILARRGNVHVLERPHKRYVGAKIGIHNPAGEKVGTASHASNREYLFVVDLSSS
ncbi:MAG: DNA adenine methylase [Planctomycetes bacterium]|nr:DNA adenine methylase [Planctomycetota bacterium]